MQFSTKVRVLYRQNDSDTTARVPQPVHPTSSSVHLSRPLVRLVGVMATMVRIVTLLATLAEETCERPREGTQQSGQGDAPCSTRRPPGFSADPEAHRTRPCRGDGVQGSRPRCPGRSPRTYRIQAAEVPALSLTAARAARKPWEGVCLASGWESDVSLCVINRGRARRTGLAGSQGPGDRNR